MTTQDPILSHTRVVAKDAEPKMWLLMLHGIYGSGRNWGTIARRLVEARPEWGVLLVDLRNLLDSEAALAAGFRIYASLGRPELEASPRKVAALA